MSTSIRKRVTTGFICCIMGMAVFAGMGALFPNEISADTGDIEINSINFPDENFREYVKQFDNNGSDGLLSQDELLVVRKIDVSSRNISTLKGIEFFTYTYTLKCLDNNLSSLDVSRNTALEELNCGDNNISSLNLSNNTALKELYCFGNELSALDVGRNTALTVLWCDDNNLSSLNVSKNTALLHLDCGGNNISSLNVSGNTALKGLTCSNNKLSSLDMSDNSDLQVLSCDNNNISSLDVSENTNLSALNCSENNISSLSVSNNTDLRHLSCNGNNISSLDVGGNTELGILSCKNNHLSTLDLTNNDYLMSGEFADQTVTGIKRFANNTWQVDMSEIVGNENIGKVEVTDGGTYDSDTGIVTYSSEPDTTTYRYTTNQKVFSHMENVVVSLKEICHVTFDSNGGSPIESQPVEKGKTVTEPKAPTKDGYIFAGWYSDEKLKNKYNFNTPVTSSFTLYAKWKEKTSSDDDPGDKTPTGKKDQKDTSGVSGQPQTGDSNMLWITLAFLTSAGTLVTARKLKENS